MDSILKADIFFFVATIATSLVGIMAIIVLWYVIKILKIIKEMSQVIQGTVLKLSDNVADAQDTVRDFFEKLNVIQLIRFAFGRKRKHTTNKKHEEHGTKE